MSRPTPTRAVLVVSLLCLFSVILSACGGSTPPSSPSNALTPASPDKQVFRYPIGQTDFASLDPALAAINTDIFAIYEIFIGPVSLKGDGTVIDQMASSHTISPDGLTYTFTLKSGLKFSDGSPLTATDVAYSINRSLLPNTKSPTAAFLSAIKDFDQVIAGKIPTLIGDSIIAQDENTLIVKLGQPAAYFLQTFANTLTYTVNKKIIDKYGDQWTSHLTEGVGAGPFKVESYDRNRGLTLVPNPNYYGQKPKLQKIEFLRSGAVDTTYKSYQAGQFDIASVPTAELERAKTRKDYKSGPALAISFLTMNYLAKPFDNIKIRQAFALAIDKDIIAEKVLHGSVKPTNHLMPEGMPGFNKDLTGPAGVASTKGDPEKAKQLLQEGLKEAGYNSVSDLPRLTYTFFNAGSDYTNLTTVLIQQWQQVLGITLQPDGLNGDVLVERMTKTTNSTGPLQIWYLGYGNYADPQGWLSTFFSKGAIFNNMNYGQNQSSTAAEQVTVQEELSKADVNLNPQERTQQYNDAEQKIVNDVGWIPLYQAQQQLLVNPKLQNLPTEALGVVAPDQWSNIYFVQ